MAQLASAPRWHRGGREFESRWVHKKTAPLQRGCFFCGVYWIKLESSINKILTQR